MAATHYLYVDDYTDGHLLALSPTRDPAGAGPYQADPTFTVDLNGQPFQPDTDYWVVDIDPLTPDSPPVVKRVRYDSGDTAGTGTGVGTWQSVTDNGARTTHDVEARTYKATAYPNIDLTKPGETVGGVDANGTVSRIALENLKTALGLIEQAYVCILPFCVPSPTTPGPTCADIGPFVWQVGVVVNVQLPDWSNAVGSQSVTGLPAGLAGFFGFGHNFITGTPTATGSGTITYTATGADGAVATKNATFTVQAAAVTPFAVKAPKYNCQTRQITYQYSGGDGSEVTWFVPGVNGNTTTPSQTVDAAIINNPNALFIAITGYQGTGASRVSSTYNFDFRAYCAAPTVNVVAPVIPTLYAVVGQSFLYAFPLFTLNGSPLTGADGVFSIANQPAGFSLNVNTWTGIAQVAGGYMLTLDFTYQGHDYTADFALVVTSPQPAFTAYNLHLYEGDVSGNPSAGGGWADFELKVMLANGNGNQAQVGTRQTQSSNGAADDTLFWFDLNTLTGDSSYNRTRKQSTTTFTGAGQYTHLLYYLRLSPASPAILLYDRLIANTDANKADKVVTGTVGLAGGSSPAPAAEGPGDASLSGTDYQGIAFTTTTAPSNLSA